MKNTVILLSLTCSIFFFQSCETTQPLSPMQKRQITTKLIEGSYSNIFSAVLSVLQDHGYVIKQTVKDTGLISGTINRESDFFVRVFTRNNELIRNSNTLIEVSVIVDRISFEASEIRISIEEKIMNNRAGVESARRIYKPELLSQLFNEISIEVKRREAFGKQ